MKFNLELAKRVRELIRTRPKQHDQDNWSTNYGENPIHNCNTSACIAGWVAAASGYTVLDVERGETDLPDRTTASDYAAAKLGIDADQEDALFYCFKNGRSLQRLDLLIETNGAADWDALDAVTDD